MKPTRDRGVVKRLFTAFLCLAVPALLILNSWQGWRYNALSAEVAALEARQDELLEANRDAIGQIAYESSPARVAEKAAALGLVPADESLVTRLSIATGAVQPPDAQQGPVQQPVGQQSAAVAAQTSVPGVGQ